MTVDSTLLLIAPELSAVPVERREAMAELAAKSVGSVFGDDRELATAYLTAHMLTSGFGGGYSGAVKSTKEGDLAITFSDGGKSNSAYTSTSYGLEFVRLQRQNVFAARTRMVC
jgi:hypothetical protein